MKLRMPEMPPAILLASLSSYNLLPAIVFLPTRRRCDEAASEAALSRRTSKDDRREARRDFMNSLVEQYPEIRRHRHWDTIVRVGFIIAAPGPHQNPQKIAELLAAPPDDLESQFHATYTSLLNLLDAFGSFAQVRAIAERSFAYRNLLPRIHQLEQSRQENEQR